MKPILISSLLLLLPFTQLCAKVQCSKDVVCIETQSKGQQILFYAINKKEHKVSINIDVKSTGMRASTTLPKIFVLKGKEKQFLLSLEHGQKAWNYNYHYDWAKGDYTAVHDTDYVYDLPYDKQDKFKVAQSCNGTFSHFGESQYAIDFVMPINTPIHAAREGIVIDTKNDSSIGGNSRSYMDDANYVSIEHSDGTLGLYNHLKMNGVAVTLGQFVTKGRLLGYSGNTGFSDGPHLHFDVKSSDSKGNPISFPSPFLTDKGIITCPKKNTYLSHQK